MTAIVLTLLVTPAAQASSSAPDEKPLVSSVRSGALADGSRVSGAVRCKSARTAAVFFRLRTHTWQELRSATRLAGPGPIVAGKSCHWSRYVAKEWAARARSAKRSYYRWRDSFLVLKDLEVRPGNRAWHRAVQEAQRPYPGTRSWLLSCSASEGGWGRWVPNSDGAPPGGWLQMHESTFWRMWATARADVHARGFRVPVSAASWYSPLGQALAGAWGLTHGRRHEWAGSGCR